MLLHASGTEDVGPSSGVPVLVDLMDRRHVRDIFRLHSALAEVQVGRVQLVVLVDHGRSAVSEQIRRGC